MCILSRQTIFLSVYLYTRECEWMVEHKYIYAQPFIHILWCVCIIRVQTLNWFLILTLIVLVMTIDAQWEGMGDVGSARYEPALLPPCLTIRVLSYNN